MITEKMSLKSLSLFTLSVFALVFVMGIASAATVFSDSFTDSGLTGWSITPTNGWTHNTGNYAESTTQAAANLSRTISTSGFNTIVVKYDRQLVEDWETADNFRASWSTDGLIYTTLEEVVGVTGTDGAPGDTAFSSKTFNLPSSANNNSNFQLRFECTTNAAEEFCRLDNVVVEGIAITTTEVPPEVTSCSTLENPGKLKVKGIDFSNNGMQYNTFGEDDQWFPFEEIETEVKVEVENNGFDVSDVSVEWGLWDTKANDGAGDWVIDLDEEDKFDIDRGDEETLTFTFKIDDDMDLDLDQLQGSKDDYIFYVVASGTIDDNDAGSLDNQDTCVVGDETVTVVIENDFVVLNNFQVPETVSCGETVTITADAWNIGDNGQDEVSVFVTNNELGIKEDIAVGDIDAFDNQQVSLTFTVPGDAEEKIYKLDFGVYDEDNDVYQDDFDDDESTFTVPLVVSGNCGAAEAEEVSVVANIASGGGEGQKLVVRATVTNTGNSQKTYALNGAGFEEWASSLSLDKNSLTLGAGESGDVSVTLDVNDDAAGSRTFFLELVSGGELVRQPVTVSISERGAGITGLVTGENWYLWGIGLLNVLLVVVIIIVAVRIARK